MNDMNLDENHLVSDHDYNLLIYNANVFHKGWQTIFGLQFVVVTIHMQFTISVEQGKYNWWRH